MVFNREEVKRVTQELIDEVGPEYVYPGASTGSCSYSGHPDGGIPACLVGQIVDRLNPEAYDKLVIFENDGIDGYTDFNYNLAIVPTLEKRVPVIDTGDDAELTRALMRAQSRQDDGLPWAEAALSILELE